MGDKVLVTTAVAKLLCEKGDLAEPVISHEAPANFTEEAELRKWPDALLDLEDVMEPTREHPEPLPVSPSEAA